MTTITSANSALSLNVPGVFPIPVPIEGYSTDDAFDTENKTPTETLMGVDGNLSGGYTPQPTKLKIVLQADSPSIAYFDQWYAAMDAAKEAYPASATLIATSLGKKWGFTQGFLTGYMPAPPGKKVLMPQTYEITFEDSTSSVV